MQITPEFSTLLSSLFTVIINLLYLIGLDNLAHNLENYAVMPIDAE